MLPPESTYPFTPDLPICRLLNGLWQVSGGHGRIDPATAIDEMISPAIHSTKITAHAMRMTRIARLVFIIGPVACT